jgi:hypothetical protein
MMSSALQHSVFDRADARPARLDLPAPGRRRRQEIGWAETGAAVGRREQGFVMATITALVFWSVIVLVVLFVAI